MKENNTRVKIRALDRVIGKQLREARKTAPWTQVQAGEAIGVSFQQIQKYEQGVSRISSASLITLLNAMDISIECFLNEVYRHVGDEAYPATDQAGPQGRVHHEEETAHSSTLVSPAD